MSRRAVRVPSSSPLRWPPVLVGGPQVVRADGVGDAQQPSAAGPGRARRPHQPDGPARRGLRRRAGPEGAGRRRDRGRPGQGRRDVRQARRRAAGAAATSPSPSSPPVARQRSARCSATPPPTARPSRRTRWAASRSTPARPRADELQALVDELAKEQAHLAGQAGRGRGAGRHAASRSRREYERAGEGLHGRSWPRPRPTSVTPSWTPRQERARRGRRSSPQRRRQRCCNGSGSGTPTVSTGAPDVAAVVDTGSGGGGGSSAGPATVRCAGTRRTPPPVSGKAGDRGRRRLRPARRALQVRRRVARRGVRLLGPHQVGLGSWPACTCRTRAARSTPAPPHVPKDQAQPGDLIFYYSPIGHVGHLHRWRPDDPRARHRHDRRGRPRCTGTRSSASVARADARPAAMRVGAHYGCRSCRASTSSRSASGWPTNIDGAVAPFTFDLIAGGRSNLTFRVDRRRRHRVRAAPPAARPRAGHRARHGP